MSDEFIKKRHEGFSTPEAKVFELVSKSSGMQPTSRKKIVKGDDNEVYRISTQQGKNFIVRIKHFGSTSFEQEAWAMEQCRNIGVPVADIFALDRITLPDGERDVMVCSEVPGKSLDILETELKPEDWDQVVEEAGRTLRRIHSIKVGGFYHRQADGTWDFPTWERLLASTAKDRSSERQLILSAGFSSQQFDFMIETIKKYAKEFPCNQPVLCPSDYWEEHVFATPDLKISGVIDFGESQGGPPVTDFAQGEQKDWFNTNHFKKGYDDPDLFDERFARRLEMQRLTTGIGYLAHHLRINHTDEIPGNIRALRRSLNFLQNET